MILFALLVCMPAFAQVEIDFVLRTTECVDPDPGLVEREESLLAGPWSSNVEVTDVGIAQASQVSDVLVDGSRLLVAADLDGLLSLEDPQGSDLLQTLSEIQIRFTVTEPSVFALHVVLADGSFFHFGDDAGGLVVQEQPGTFDLEGAMAPGVVYFLVVSAGGTRSMAGVSLTEFGAEALLEVAPEGTIPADAATLDQVKCLYR